MNNPHATMALVQIVGFFREMSEQEARQFFEQYIEAKDERYQYLREHFQAAGGGTADMLDFSPQSLVPLWTWAAKRIHRRPHTPEELAQLGKVTSDLAREEQLRTLPLSEESLSLINDIAYYLGDVCVRNLSGVQWEVCITEIPYYIDNNHPVLTGFTLLSRNPFLTVAAIAGKTVDGKVGSDALLGVYSRWSEQHPSRKMGGSQ